jgi:hypothetical protein
MYILCGHNPRENPFDFNFGVDIHAIHATHCVNQTVLFCQYVEIRVRWSRTELRSIDRPSAATALPVAATDQSPHSSARWASNVSHGPTSLQHIVAQQICLLPCGGHGRGQLQIVCRAQAYIAVSWAVLAIAD